MTPLAFTIPKRLWLSSNRPARNLAYRSRLVRALHQIAIDAASEIDMEPIDERVHAIWTIHYPRGVGWQHGDASNAHPTTKALLDGLVLGGWLRGDGPRYVRPETYDRGPNLTTPGDHRIVLELTPLETPTSW
ncbi:MAG: hypothetical protein J0H73_11810 [Salana multivorans]|uniref:hypothetical protein n=1 Tax=Salana multivorans TaxID=120377 RepID=UPI00095B9000|nr:hypothetical protein [Salana multivorans]MBN8882985.1 hypothetical protein [Salana multivorans]OJX94063.1 MAG: hypothetical protein BGO96_09660 [Micrococcales bacterium 73-15]